MPDHEDEPLLVDPATLRTCDLLTQAPEVSASAGSSVRRELRAFEKERILAALSKTGGNQTRAAVLLGLSRRTLTNKLTAHEIERPRKRTIGREAAE